MVVREENTLFWLLELQWWPQSRNGLEEVPFLLPPFFWATFWSNLLCVNAAQKMCEIITPCYFKQGPSLQAPVPSQHLWPSQQQGAAGSQQGGGDVITSLASFPSLCVWPESAPLTLQRSSRLSPDGEPSPLAPISLSVYGWTLAPIHVCLPLQPPLQDLSILLGSPLCKYWN